MDYDGSTDLNTELAKLYKCSSGDNNKMSALRTEAQKALGIDVKKLSQEQRQAIYNWHCQKLNVVENDSQSHVESISQPVNEPVEHVSQAGLEHVEDIQQAGIGAVEGIQQPYNSDKLARVAFYTTIDGIKKRQVIALHGFMLNALMVAIGKNNKADIPKWLNAQSFVGSKSITLQVQQLIAQALLHA